MEDEIKCDECSIVLNIGDWPYCPHGTTHEYRPFVPFYDIGLGKHIDSLATWNRTMHEKGWDLRSKYDREEPERKAGAPGLSKVFNETIRKQFGGVLPVGNFLDDRD